MAVSRRPARQRFVLVVVTLLSITVITLDQRGQTAEVIDGIRDVARDVFAPVQSTTDAVLSPIGDAFGGVFNYGDLKAENRRLRRELAEARGRAARAGDLERELEALHDLEGLTFTGDIPSVAARVVATAPSNFELTIQVDKGTEAGVAEGMPVITGDGLVGRVVETSSRRATILLVADRTSSVGIRLSGSGDVGVAEGRGAGVPLQVDLIDPATKVRAGEIAVTSGLQQSVFPPGVPVGRVVIARARPGELRQEVTIRPLVDLRRLAFVEVLQWAPR
jgi:rod shape-determining protein MreC